MLTLDEVIAEEMKNPAFKAEWNTFLEGLDNFTDDFFQDGRKQEPPQIRESVDF